MGREKRRDAFTFTGPLVAFVVFLCVALMLLGLTETVKNSDVTDTDFIMLTESENVFERFKADQSVLDEVDSDPSEEKIVSDLYYNESGLLIQFDGAGVPIKAEDVPSSQLVGSNFNIGKTKDLALIKDTYFGAYKYIIHIEVNVVENSDTEDPLAEPDKTYFYSFSLSKGEGKILFATDSPQLVLTSSSKIEEELPPLT